MRRRAKPRDSRPASEIEKLVAAEAETARLLGWCGVADLRRRAGENGVEILAPKGIVLGGGDRGRDSGWRGREFMGRIRVF